MSERDREQPYDLPEGEDDLALLPGDRLDLGVDYEQLPRLLDWPETTDPFPGYDPNPSA